MASLLSLPPVLQALLAGALTFTVTALGALCVFFFRRAHSLLLDAMLAAGAGVMLASSFFSLLQPAQEMAIRQGQPAALILCTGFLLGGILLLLADHYFDCRSRSLAPCDARRRDRLLVASITLHNIPEGLAVGAAFGAAAADPTLYHAAWMLAVGIALQNFPEGAAVSLPLHRDGMSRGKAFLLGALSALVEPIAALVGVLLAAGAQALLPLLLAFAAGAMVLVVVSELVPECQRSARPRTMALAVLVGFAVMMTLDVALG